MFQLAYPEGSVLDMALFIAIREWESRLADPRLETLHDETREQIRIAKNVRSRLFT